jgi:hypothetical protein
VEGTQQKGALDVKQQKRGGAVAMGTKRAGEVGVRKKPQNLRESVRCLFFYKRVWCLNFPKQMRPTYTISCNIESSETDGLMSCTPYHAFNLGYFLILQVQLNWNGGRT